MNRAWELLRADVAAAVARRPHEGRARYLLRALLLVWFTPRYRAVLLFRVAQVLHGTARPLAVVLTGRAQRSTGAELHPGARVGPGLRLFHSNGVVVGERVVAGRGLRLYQGVTLGDRRPFGDQPVLGDHVTVCAGACVLGGVHVGDGAVIGAGSVVLHDVAPGAVVAGAPARPLRDGASSPFPGGRT